MDARIELTFNGKTELLYSSAANDDKSALINPQVKAEIGKAGSLTFTILPTHPMYDNLQPFRTFLRVRIDGTEIFYGRVLDISKDMYNQKSVTCEGDLTFLMDSVCTPGDYNVTPKTLLQNAINWHNSMVENAKKFTLGTVSTNIKMRNTDVKFDLSSYTTNADILETEVINYYGGYLRTRANQNGNRYLDWVQEGDSSSTQVIEYGSQMLDLTNDESANDLFTILLAVGDGESTTGKDYNFPKVTINVDDVITGANATATYGQITHVESFSGISDTTKLQTLGEEYIRNHYDPYPTELNIKAIDLHMVDSSIQTILVGDTVTIRSTPHNLSKRLMCVSIDYDLESPENTSYIFGHPKQTLSQRYSKEKKEAKSETGKASKGGGKAGKQGDLNEEAIENEVEKREEEVAKAWVQIDKNKGTIEAHAETIDVFTRELNLQAGHISIDASKIDMTSVFTYINARRTDLNVGVLDASQVIVGDSGLSVPNGKFTVTGGSGGSSVSWQDKEVVVGVSYKTAGTGRLMTYSGNETDFLYVSSVSSSKDTIYYLGR